MSYVMVSLLLSNKTFIGCLPVHEMNIKTYDRLTWKRRDFMARCYYKHNFALINVKDKFTGIVILLEFDKDIIHC